MGGKPLFYDPGRARGGNPAHRQSDKTGENLAEWIRDDIGTTDDRIMSNHAWRHRFRLLGRPRQVPTDVPNALDGRADESVADTYGGYSGPRCSTRVSPRSRAPSWTVPTSSLPASAEPIGQEVSASFAAHMAARSLRCESDIQRGGLQLPADGTLRVTGGTDGSAADGRSGMLGRLNRDVDRAGRWQGQWFPCCCHQLHQANRDWNRTVPPGCAPTVLRTHDISAGIASCRLAGRTTRRWSRPCHRDSRPGAEKCTYGSATPPANASGGRPRLVTFGLSTRLPPPS